MGVVSRFALVCLLSASLATSLPLDERALADDAYLVLTRDGKLKKSSDVQGWKQSGRIYDSEGKQNENEEVYEGLILRRATGDDDTVAGGESSWAGDSESNQPTFVKTWVPHLAIAQSPTLVGQSQARQSQASSSWGPDWTTTAEITTQSVATWIPTSTWTQPSTTQWTQSSATTQPSNWQRTPTSTDYWKPTTTSQAASSISAEWTTPGRTSTTATSIPYWQSPTTSDEWTAGSTTEAWGNGQPSTTTTYWAPTTTTYPWMNSPSTTSTTQWWNPTTSSAETTTTSEWRSLPAATHSSTSQEQETKTTSAPWWVPPTSTSNAWWNPGPTTTSNAWWTTSDPAASSRTTPLLDSTTTPNVWSIPWSPIFHLSSSTDVSPPQWPAASTDSTTTTTLGILAPTTAVWTPITSMQTSVDSTGGTASPTSAATQAPTSSQTASLIISSSAASPLISLSASSTAAQGDVAPDYSISVSTKVFTSLAVLSTVDQSGRTQVATSTAVYLSVATQTSFLIAGVTTSNPDIARNSPTQSASQSKPLKTKSPSSVLAAPEATGSGNQSFAGSSPATEQQSRAVNIGAIVGGVVGGIVLAILLIPLIQWIRRRRNSRYSAVSRAQNEKSIVREDVERQDAAGRLYGGTAAVDRTNYRVEDSDEEPDPSHVTYAGRPAYSRLSFDGEGPHVADHSIFREDFSDRTSPSPAPSPALLAGYTPPPELRASRASSQAYTENPPITRVEESQRTEPEASDRTPLVLPENPPPPGSTAPKLRLGGESPFFGSGRMD